MFGLTLESVSGLLKTKMKNGNLKCISVHLTTKENGEEEISFQYFDKEVIILEREKFLESLKTLKNGE
jgi:hypothetical protein